MRRSRKRLTHGILAIVVLGGMSTAAASSCGSNPYCSPGTRQDVEIGIDASSLPASGQLPTEVCIKVCLDQFPCYYVDAGPPPIVFCDPACGAI
jgi:hypothetical protein